MKTIQKTLSLILKAFVSFCVAYVIALIGQELISYGLFSFVFIMLSVGLGFFSLIKPVKGLILFMGLILAGLALWFSNSWTAHKSLMAYEPTYPKSTVGFFGPIQKVYGNARVFGGARVYGSAEVYDNARIYGNAIVDGVIVKDNAVLTTGRYE